MSEQPLSILDDSTDDVTNPQRKRRGLRIVLTVLLVLILGVGGIVGIYASSMWRALDAVQRDDSMMPLDQGEVTGGETTAAPGEAKKGEGAGEGQGGEGSPEKALPPISYGATKPVNIVLMGSDSRGSDRGRSDVLQLIHIPGSRDAAYLVSFPRDSWVDIPGRGKGKINWAYSFGGPALTVSTLNRILTVPMDHAVVTNFEGFVNVIDTLGGVTVYNRHSSSSGGFDFPKGEITLNGEQALRFVRERYDLPGGDFARAQRQRDVIGAIGKKLSSAGVVSNPVKFNEAVTKLGSQFKVDSGLTNDVIVGLGMESSAAFNNIRSLGLPNAGTGMVGDQSVVHVNWDAVHDLRVALRTDTMKDFYSKYGG
ncbi:MAG: LCP family protein [Propioniciclava sp.]|uniref:LCP family protein n=1 Tax=Propioniciclava sp. TaxID=2038686 RepID=UPI0039E622D8